MTSSVDLYWLPLGAGGRFVAFNGRVYERIQARRQDRAALDLYHTALIVTGREGRFVIENAWPIPDADGERRGVVAVGPVGFDWIGRFRTFRYEVRRWRDGAIADIDYAVASPQSVSCHHAIADRILDLVPAVPSLLWGRKPAGAEEMWNSNSVISWLLSRSGVDMEPIHPPDGGKAPGWTTGMLVAHRSLDVRDQQEREAGQALRILSTASSSESFRPSARTRSKVS